MCTSFPVVYSVSHSIRVTIVTTLAASLLLQLAYFGSVLFLVWRNNCARRAVRAPHHLGFLRRGHPNDR
ncbi:exopolysaccharide production repressor protein [Rhizobium sp. 007]|uniref:exopolysaccharide production repressor protein n=1 Tax=Rhizobium sp. 007 TaxID=2785056 RepID=UPI001FF00285|nr:exopolysaccharide production repressor protein [Rhizobium sp. 007]